MNSNWSYSPETANLGQILRFLEPCDLEIWRMTLKNNRAPLQCHFKLWPWSFAWTLPWSVVITPDNFMMIRWWEHSQKGVTDRQTDGQTDRQTENTIHRAAWSQLKILHVDYQPAHYTHNRWLFTYGSRPLSKKLSVWRLNYVTTLRPQ